MKQLIGRKFFLGSFIAIAGTALAAFGKLTAEFVTLSLGVMGAFSAADTLITRTALKEGKAENGTVQPG